jgi:hypothetical protein
MKDSIGRARDNRRQTGERPILQVGDDLFDDRVAAVVGLGVEHRQWRVGEHRMVSPGGEQFALPIREDVIRVGVADPAHDQPPGNLLRGGRLIEYDVRLTDRRPRILADRGDRRLDRRVFEGGMKKRAGPRRIAAMVSSGIEHRIRGRSSARCRRTRRWSAARQPPAGPHPAQNAPLPGANVIDIDIGDLVRTRQRR